ncbi:cupin domain-containing protein [Streptomyces ipomoeae]|uniref:Cupin domain-containing protein n=2 Tax=Streptomyces ipomoeae TaxID=103232 RepID=A0AAE9B2K4_9ACTN|nr:class I tRNA ligase family protein [Streptomyces ipomoeae]EKX61620.1 putative methionine--tRNA ligase [Streptomyces ipomoeae 91-03]MDX2693332.1 class I tRNA ligase family protein [Streptomyces ipomoeae]MDX2820880.1 class I tRNA ligase family protein [Streptomyces ipomoeae]MDX2838969.1 class I tRNA ligase family protein [Streptomyces ipomoeae]MDX2873376.1 class I tRNA ligase family protein [Streptomyces ipomoeae]
MRIDTFDPVTLSDAFGIDMSTIDLPGVVGLGASWGRVPPGRRSDAHQHDEIEMFVIVSGSGEIVVDGARHPVGPGTVVKFDPFETHVIDNTGDTDIVFVTCYWREPRHAAETAARTGRRRFTERPVFVFSTPPTPNGDLHLGHLSGPYLGADAFVRFQRMNGTRAWHLTGSDDYQSYVVAQATQEGSTPERIASHYGAEIARTLELMDIRPDQFTVTSTDADYREGLRDFFAALETTGKVARRELPALFDGETGRYLYEVDVTGTCPSCEAAANGNICEECGEPNIASDLVEARSRISDSARAGSLSRYALPLHEFREAVARHHRLGRVPARLRELAERVFARETLDLPLSHPAQWGVPPRDTDDQVIWVWPEMSYGFLHGIARLGARLGETWQADKPEQDWKIVHFFGYDNSFYHAILYPVLYGLAFPDWEPDIDYHVNEFYLLDNQKFSTSRRHAVWGKEILSPQTVDAVRFYLSRTRPEGERTNFEREAYTATVREVLIDGWQGWLDDLGHRLKTRFDGVVPDAGIWTPEHTAFYARLGRRLSAVTAHLGQDGFSLRAATAELEGIVTDARAFAEREEVLLGAPGWQSENRTAMALELAAARLLSRVATPVMPRFAARLAALLGESEPPWPSTVDLIPAGTTLDLTGQTFFAAEPARPLAAEPAPSLAAESAPPEPSETAPDPLPWFADLVRSTLGLPAEAVVADKTLRELGASSLQAVAMQYQILERLDLDVPMTDLLSERNIAALSRELAGEVTR